MGGVCSLPLPVSCQRRLGYHLLWRAPCRHWCVAPANLHDQGAHLVQANVLFSAAGALIRRFGSAQLVVHFADPLRWARREVVGGAIGQLQEAQRVVLVAYVIQSNFAQ